MRTLSNKERGWLKAHATRDSISFKFRDLFSKEFLDYIFIELDHQNQNLKLSYDRSKTNTSSVFQELVTLVGFVNMLQKHDLVYKLKSETPLNKIQTIGYAPMSDQFYFEDSSFKRKLLEDMLSEYFITEELRFFSKKNFNTREQLRHKKILWVTWGALIVSILIGLYK